jgi:hypothetical protein
VRPRPAHDRQAAGALVAALRRAGVAEQRVTHAAGVDGGGELRRRDELVALPVRKDQDRPAVAGDQRARLGRCADGELVAGARGAGAHEVRERRHARGRHRPGATRHLDAAVRHRDRARQRQGEDRRERARGGEAGGSRARARR